MKGQHMIRYALRQLFVKVVLLSSVLIATACGTSTPAPKSLLPTPINKPTPTYTPTPVFSGTLTPIPHSLSEYFITQEFKECLSQNECKDLKVIDVYEFPASTHRDGWEEQWCVTFDMSRYGAFGKGTKFWSRVYASYWLARLGNKWIERGYQGKFSTSCTWAQEIAWEIAAEPTATKDIRTPTPTLDVSKCLHVPIMLSTPSGKPNPNDTYGAREPELAKNAPNGACLEFNGEYVIKRAAGTPININWHVAWNPNASIMVVKGDEWVASGIDNEGVVQYLRSKGDKLYLANSDPPVLQVLDDDSYIALINMYEFVPKD
jgi:hypothetical protein